MVMDRAYLDQVIRLIYCPMDLDFKKHLVLVTQVELHSFIVPGQKHHQSTCMVGVPMPANINN